LICFDRYFLLFFVLFFLYFAGALLGHAAQGLVGGAFVIALDLLYGSRQE